MSLQNEVIKLVMQYRRRAFDKVDYDLLKVRRYMDDLFVKTFFTPWTVTINPIELEGLVAEIITPKELKRDDAIILYVHGGGYFMGSVNTHRPLAGWVAHETGLPVVIFDYKLAPEHPFPAGRDDLIRIYGRLSQEYPADRIVLVGDSAGAGLIPQALLEMKELGMKLPNCSCLMSPFLDFTVSAESLTENKDKDHFVIPKFLEHVVPYYIKDPYHPEHPSVNVLYADLSELPPFMVFASSTEVLRDDSRNFTKAVIRSGGQCKLSEYGDLPHVWQFNRQFFMPESQEAFKEMSEYILERIPVLTETEA